MAAPLAESFMMWRCKCGKTSFRHHEHCDSCGEAQPEPPPEAEKSDVGRPDPGSVTGGMDMGLDVARRTDYASNPGRENSWWSNPDGDGSWFTREAQMQRADEPMTPEERHDWLMQQRADELQDIDEDEDEEC